jgi:hypothetical protein
MGRSIEIRSCAVTRSLSLAIVRQSTNIVGYDLMGLTGSYDGSGPAGL